MHASSPSPTTTGRVVRRIPVSSNFELYAWLFMRISGVLLVLLALGHMAIMHVLNDVATVNFAFIAARWASPFWRIYDELLLVLALIHGGNGMRVIFDDYIRSPGWRLVAMIVLYVVVIALLIVGSLILLTFQPVP